MLVKQGLEFVDLQIGKRKDIGFVNRPELDVADIARFQHIDLLLRTGVDFVGEGGNDKHRRSKNKTLLSDGQAGGKRKRTIYLGPLLAWLFLHKTSARRPRRNALSSYGARQNR